MSPTMTPDTDRPPTAAATVCTVCGTGRRQPDTTTITVERDGAVLVFRLVPALVCDDCEDALLDPHVVRELERQVAAAIASGVKADVRDYQAA